MLCLIKCIISNMCISKEMHLFYWLIVFIIIKFKTAHIKILLPLNINKCEIVWRINTNLKQNVKLFNILVLF